jgi:hypothetical protein
MHIGQPGFHPPQQMMLQQQVQTESAQLFPG